MTLEQLASHEADELSPLFDTISSREWDGLAAAAWHRVAKVAGIAVDDYPTRENWLQLVVAECSARSDKGRSCGIADESVAAGVG